MILDYSELENEEFVKMIQTDVSTENGVREHLIKRMKHMMYKLLLMN